jgi:hypothetical protein
LITDFTASRKRKANMEPKSNVALTDESNLTVKQEAKANPREKEGTNI